MTLPEIIYSSSAPTQSKRISKWLDEGNIKKLIPRVYTSALDKTDEELIRNNWQQILARLYPQAFLSHRSALEYNISPKDNIYLTYSDRRVLKWPGVTIKMSKGPDALEDDAPLYGSLRVSSLERACLENLTSSRKAGGERRTVDQEVIEQRLMQILNTKGEAGLNALRDRARTISKELDMTKPFEKLNKLISAILTTQTSGQLVSAGVKALALGKPYDSDRLALFSLLIAYLRGCTFESRPWTGKANAFVHMSFIESYFSNYIEGTTFLVEEAEDIVFKDKKIKNRTGDSHDIKGTFEICVDKDALSQLPQDADAFIDLLRSRHAVLLAGRPEKNPGAFKTKPNRAGSTYFVDPDKVLGTLEQGFELMVGLQDPLARALYMMYLVSEVHPFDDGNGRIARIMMNAELVATVQTKLNIPTVYREDYLLNLRKLSRQREPAGFVRMMDRAHCFSHWLRPRDMQVMKDQLHMSNAFKESDEAALQFPYKSKTSFTIQES